MGYRSGQRQFVRMLREKRVKELWLPLSESDLLVFANWLYGKGYAHATVCNYVTAVGRLNYDMGFGKLRRGEKGEFMPVLHD